MQERERWEQVKRIVSACLDLEPADRKSYAATACLEHPSLLGEVEEMLAAHERVGDFLETPAIEADSHEQLTGKRIGSYQLCEIIAEGGMGSVYRAVRATDFNKQVAIKLVKRGMDSSFVLERFRHERQILAGLDHPNIARLIDGGAADDGRPYLVMEYIDGTPITAYADEQHLGIAEKLELFRTVCAAVHYAHQNLVIHRDLKPGNILVTADGSPKLLDFGIAKLLEPDANVTAAYVRMMTPYCASPEQVRGEPVTTASDVYSLGVLLYHLLTGARPYEFATGTQQELTRLVCETDPRKPSSLRPLPSDLDVIVMKAMHKDPARRYASAEQLSDDIRRYLAGLPITARKDTFAYLASKFVVRHKGASIAAGLAALSLIGGMAATLWEAHIARAERARAERRFNDVRRLTNSVLFEVHDSIRVLPGATAARELLVRRSVEFLDNLAQDAGKDHALDRELAAGYERLGQVQGQAGTANLGNGQGALASFQKAAALRESLARADPSNAHAQTELAGTYDLLAQVMVYVTHDWKAVDQYDQRAFEIRKAAAPRLPEVEAQKSLASSYYQIALHRALRENYDGALEYYQQYLDAWQKIAGANPNDWDQRLNRSIGNKRIGAILIIKNRLPEALEHYRAAETLDQERIARRPENAEARMDLTYAYSDIGLIYLRQGDPAAALASYHKAEAIREELAAGDPKNARARASLISTYQRIGNILKDRGDTRGAEKYRQKELALSAPPPPKPQP
jgi:tetratricopeptide (TPR) repeat protein